MPRVQILDDERDKQDRKYVADFEAHVAPQYIKKPTESIIEVDTERKGSVTYVCGVPAEGLAQYGLEIPEWANEVAEGYTFGVWQNAHGVYELRRPSPSAYTHGVRPRSASVEAGVFFNHLPGGFRQFKNKREAREYVQREHGIDLNL